MTVDPSEQRLQLWKQCEPLKVDKRSTNENTCRWEGSMVNGKYKNNRWLVLNEVLLLLEREEFGRQIVSSLNKLRHVVYAMMKWVGVKIIRWRAWSQWLTSWKTLTLFPYPWVLLAVAIHSSTGDTVIVIHVSYYQALSSARSLRAPYDMGTAPS